MIEALFFSAGILLGFTMGFLGGRFAKNKEIVGWQQKMILVAVVLLYSISILTAVTNPSYETPWFLHVIAGLVFGHYFEFNFEKFINFKK